MVMVEGEDEVSEMFWENMVRVIACSCGGHEDLTENTCTTTGK
jgi:hypothetical protein